MANNLNGVVFLVIETNISGTHSEGVILYYNIVRCIISYLCYNGLMEGGKYEKNISGRRR